ncbi:MAG TPA: M28 family peptidase, partial [Ignavibacteriaceae bacterium]
IKPKRSILFIATTGEEKGLLGSNYYIDHPVVPLYRSIANVNVDGIAMFKDFESIIGIGSEYSSLETDLRQTAKKFNLSVQEIPDEFRKTGEFTGSDQFAFAMAGIPSILISEGTKNKTKSEQEILEAFIDYYLNKYHTPFDDLNQNINYDAAVKHAKIIFDFCYNLADSSIEPQWHKGINFINARLRSIAERR